MSVFMFNFNKIFDNLNLYNFFFLFICIVYNVDNLHIKYLLIFKCLIKLLKI